MVTDKHRPLAALILEPISGFLAFAGFFVSGLAEDLGSAKQRHIRHNILISI